MSRHCKGCHHDPAQCEGDKACPFATLYRDFPMRHAAVLAAHPRMALQVKHRARLIERQQQAVRGCAAAIRRGEVA